MNLRPYQHDAIESTLTALQTHRSALIVAPTGTGKTVIMGHLIRRWTSGRVMVIAHREELIHQSAAKIATIHGEQPDIEKAERRADMHMFGRTRVVVASVQTLISGNPKRLTRFKPEDFTLILTDEAHHAPASSYRQIYSHFMANPACKHVGVTATPDRADEKALGLVYENVAFDYEVSDAIHDGWLVPITQTSVEVNGLDYSQVGVTAGDLNQGDIAAAQSNEQIIQGFADSIVRIADGRKTIVFATPGSVKGSQDEDNFHISERLTELINDRLPHSARRVHQGTHPDDRRKAIDDFREGRIKFLVNVGIFTEGFDEPGVEIVAVTRPTKSRALYAQMVGRGTRPLPGIVDGIDAADDRRAAIAASPKRSLEVLDFEGNAGRHKLVNVTDILGGKLTDEVMKRVKKSIASREKVDIAAEIERVQTEMEREAEERRRQRSLARAQYETRTVSAFGGSTPTPERRRGWDHGEHPSERQLAFLARHGIQTWKGITKAQASGLIGRFLNGKAKPVSAPVDIAARWKDSKPRTPRPPVVYREVVA